MLRAIDAVEKEEAKCDGDERTGLRILKRALEAPTRQIAENSGADGGVVVGQMRAGKGNYGFDAAAGKYVDLVEAGIIDPTKVVRVALENAVSVASVLLLTEATLTEIPGGEAGRRAGPAGCRRNNELKQLATQYSGGNDDETLVDDSGRADDAPSCPGGTRPHGRQG